MEQGHNTLLVKDIGFLADEGSFHFVDGLLEEFFVLSDQQFLDALQAALPLSDRINLDALDKHLDQRC